MGLSNNDQIDMINGADFIRTRDIGLMAVRDVLQLPAKKVLILVP